MYPLKMNPAFQDYIWGGTRLRELYGKQTDLSVIAESWEISCHPAGPSIVANGELAGRTLAQTLADHPDWTGERCAHLTQFPLLIKLIDARESLSVQVHPGDDYAQRVENELGKNEMWYVMDAAPGASLVVGFERPVGRDELRERIAQGTLTEVTRSIPVRAGDCYCIPAGMLHAIGAGTLIAEVQQSSNITYRVYDFGRKGLDGRPRELHIDKALDVTDTALRAENTGHTPGPLADWRYFHAERLPVDGEILLRCDQSTFRCLLAVSGSAVLHTPGGEVALAAGESAFLPAGLGLCTLCGRAELLLAHM